MSKLHSAMVIYGAVDDAVVGARSPQIIKLLTERYEQTWQISQRGWYSQIRQLAAAKEIDDALEDLATVDLAADAQPTEQVLTKYDLRRLYYNTRILRDLEAACSALADDEPDRALISPDPQKLKAVQERIKHLIPEDYGDPPGTCTSFVREVNGEYATALLTDSFEDKVSVNQLKKVLNPQNWPKVSTFFMAMEDLKVDDFGWQQLMEVIGTGTNAGFRLRTPLKFFMGQLGDGSVFVNYDMVDNASGFKDSDHLVVVDNGYVIAVPAKPGHPEAPGVRLHTSKELLIRGMSPTAAANLACRLGWADAGEGMFFDVAASPGFAKRKDLAAWVDSKATKTAPARSVDALENAAGPQSWTLPPGNRKQIFDTAAKTANAVVESTARAFGTFAGRWQDGLTPEDITAVGTELGDELTRTYESMFATAIDAVRPGSTPANGGKPSS
jgi:hypothetical protein